MDKSKLKALGVRLPPQKVEGPNPYRDPVQLKPSLPAGLAERLGLPNLDLLKRPPPKK